MDFIMRLFDRLLAPRYTGPTVAEIAHDMRPMTREEYLNNPYVPHEFARAVKEAGIFEK
jgi:hypothetical protein